MKFTSSIPRLMALLVIACLPYTACSSAEDNIGLVGETLPDRDTPATEEQLSIRKLVEKYYIENFYIGIANHAKLIGQLSTEIADREFNYITPANDFKQSYIHPTFDRWRWELPDNYLAHAKEQGQLLRVHGPISPQCSPWIREDNRTPEELSRMLDEFMTALCIRYGADKTIRWMDVVNETICPEVVKGGGEDFEDRHPGDWFGPRKGNDKWENPWTILGQDEESELQVPLYISRAFELATRHTSADLKLIINQHGRFEQVVWEKLKKLVGYLRGKGYRVDGLGWQAHIELGWEKLEGNLERLDSMIKWCHANGLEFHVTEMNVWMKTTVDEAAQADTFAAVLRVLLQNRHTGVVGMNYWNVRDEDTTNAAWQGNLWRNDGTPRPAYLRIKKELIDNINR